MLFCAREELSIQFHIGRQAVRLLWGRTAEWGAKPRERVTVKPPGESRSG